jgi:hypothetical protein
MSGNQTEVYKIDDFCRFASELYNGRVEIENETKKLELIQLIEGNKENFRLI